VNSLLQHSLEAALGAQAALVGLRNKTLDHGEVGFGLTHYRTDIDFGRGLAQTHAAATTARVFQQAMHTQLMNNLGQVASRDAMGVCNLSNRLNVPIPRKSDTL